MNNMNQQEQTQINPQANMTNNQATQNAFLSNPYINNTQQVNPYINQDANSSAQNPIDNQNNVNDSFFNGDFVKGALIGAGVTFLLTNKTTQKAIFNGFSKGSELVQAGMEELKERMEDAKAQMEAKNY